MSGEAGRMPGAGAGREQPEAEDTTLPLATAWSVGRSCAVQSPAATTAQHPTAQQHHICNNTDSRTAFPPLLWQ